MPSTTPGELEVYSFYRQHFGPRFEAAGLNVQFHYNQKPGIHFKVPTRQEYRSAILKGIEEGVTARFPHFPKTGSVWITGILEDPVDSSARAFYKVGRLVIDQAYLLTNMQTAVTLTDRRT